MDSSRKETLKSILLWGLLGLSLLLNVVVLLLLNSMRIRAINTLESAQTTLQEMQAEPIRTVVKVDQTIPIQEVIPFDHTFPVSLDTTYPLSTVIQTSVQIPLLGRQEIVVPVEADIPLQMDMDVPIQTDIPVSFTYQLQVAIPVEVAIPPEVLTPIDTLLEQTVTRLR